MKTAQIIGSAGEDLPMMMFELGWQLRNPAARLRNGFFVAAEFAIKGPRKPAKPMLKSGDWRSDGSARGKQPDALALIIWPASWLGERSLMCGCSNRLRHHPQAQHSLSFGVAFTVITFLHISGRARQIVAIQRPRNLLIAAPLLASILFPFHLCPERNMFLRITARVEASTLSGRTQYHPQPSSTQET
jgi:hypothetical protein